MRMVEWSPAQADLPNLIHALIAGQADLVEITTPETAATELAIRHGLGRVPRGWWVVKGDPGANVAAGSAEGTVYGRTLVPFYAGAQGSVDTVEMSPGGTLNTYVAVRAGSLTGMSAYFYVPGSLLGDVITITAKIGGAPAMSLGGEAMPTGFTALYATQDPGVDTYAAGALFTVDLVNGDEAGTPQCAVWLELSDEQGIVAGAPGSTLDLTPETAWTDEWIYLKFAVENVPLTLAVF